MAWLDPAIRLHQARLVVLMRLVAQARLLRRWRNEVPEARYALTRAGRLLAELRGRVRQAPSVSALRGLEGVAARLYFGALRRLVPASLGFLGRRRRPPTDPFNAVLSLGFTLLHARALECAHRAGLDPAVGALHDPSHGRPSLACDLVEAERSAIEAEALRLFRSRVLEARHFGRTGEACLLTKEGRPIFFVAMEPVLRRAEARMARRVARLIRHLPPLDGTP